MQTNEEKKMKLKKVANDNFKSLENFLDDVMYELEEYITWLDENHADSKEKIVTQKVYDMFNSVNTHTIYKVYQKINS